MKASHKKIDDSLVEKVHRLMELKGETGLVAKVCMLAGLTEDEASYCYNQEICNNSCCSCHKLHIVNKRNGMTVVIINWARDHGRRIYFALMPTLLWDRFRGLTALNEDDIRAINNDLKKTGIELSCLARIFYKVMKTSMDANEIDVLVGKASLCAAKCLLLSDLDDLIDNYVYGWQKIALILPIL